MTLFLCKVNDLDVNFTIWLFIYIFNRHKIYWLYCNEIFIMKYPQSQAMKVKIMHIYYRKVSFCCKKMTLTLPKLNDLDFKLAGLLHYFIQYPNNPYLWYNNHENPSIKYFERAFYVVLPSRRRPFWIKIW